MSQPYQEGICIYLHCRLTSPQDMRKRLRSAEFDMNKSLFGNTEEMVAKECEDYAAARANKVIGQSSLKSALAQNRQPQRSRSRDRRPTGRDGQGAHSGGGHNRSGSSGRHPSSQPSRKRSSPEEVHTYDRGQSFKQQGPRQLALSGWPRG